MGGAGYTLAMDEQEARFHKLMAILAARSRVELDELEIEIYDRQLAPHGYRAVVLALEEILTMRGPNDPFPTIQSILEKIGVAPPPKSLAMDAANRILAAVRTKGWNWDQKVPDFQAAQLDALGPLGAAVVKRLGGWQAVIEMAKDERNPSQMRAWLRETALAVSEVEAHNARALPPAQERKALK